MIPLRTTLTRRIGRLVVTIDGEGITLRGFRRRKRRRFTWAQVASLAGPEHPATRFAEHAVGKRELARLGATLDDPTKEDSAALSPQPSTLNP